MYTNIYIPAKIRAYMIKFVKYLYLTLILADALFVSDKTNSVNSPPVVPLV